MLVNELDLMETRVGKFFGADIFSEYALLCMVSLFIKNGSGERASFRFFSLNFQPESVFMLRACFKKDALGYSTPCFEFESNSDGTCLLCMSVDSMTEGFLLLPNANNLHCEYSSKMQPTAERGEQDVDE